MNIVTGLHDKATKETLEVIDELRADVVSGKIIALAAVGLARDDATFGYIGTPGTVSRLRFQGALHNILHSLANDDL